MSIVRLALYSVAVLFVLYSSTNNHQTLHHSFYLPAYHKPFLILSYLLVILQTHNTNPTALGICFSCVLIQGLLKIYKINFEEGIALFRFRNVGGWPVFTQESLRLWEARCW